MSDIYVDCAGDFAANGVYEPLGGGYVKSVDGNYTITYNGSYWELRGDSYSSPYTLYRLYDEYPPNDPVSLTDWEAVLGSSPVPKSALGAYPSCASGVDNNIYVYRKDGQNYILKSNNNFYVRKS